jgi:TRAP-type C4-dicarboxylate transport system substrate-binding protein
MPDMKTTTMVRAYLERKDGAFVSTTALLKNPEVWDQLTAESRRLIKRYAAKAIKIRIEPQY